MDTIPHFEVCEPVFEDESLDQVPERDRHGHDGEERRYSAEAVVDVLDPYAAIIDGIAVTAPKS